MAANGDALVSWRTFALWRDDLCRCWGKSVVVTMAACAPHPKEGHRDRWTVWAVPLATKMPEPTDPHIGATWPSERFTSVPALLTWCIIELDRLLLEKEAERRTQAAF
jgi:hypothetical protein